jgi:phosphoribulokinase
MTHEELESRVGSIVEDAENLARRLVDVEAEVVRIADNLVGIREEIRASVQRLTNSIAVTDSIAERRAHYVDGVVVGLEDRIGQLER